MPTTTIPISPRALFWVSPAGQLKELFDQLHDLTDIAEAIRISALHGVDFVS